MRFKGLLATAVFALVGSSSQAAQIVRTFDVSASNFVLRHGDGSFPPVDPVKLDFTLTFDPSVNVGPTSDGLDILSSTLPGPVEFSYFPGTLIVATHAGPGSCSFGAAGDFCAFIYDPASANPDLVRFGQLTSANPISSWDATVGGVSVSGVPEPSTWAISILGLGGAGASLRRRRRALTAAERRQAGELAG